MRIAIVLNTSWNVYNFRMGLIKAIQDNGHEVVVIAPQDDYTPKLTEAGCVFEKVTMDSRGANPLKDLGLVLELYKIYKKVKPEVILQYTIKPNIYGTIAASLLKIPVVNNVCGLGTVFLQKNLVSKVASVMYKIAFRFPKKVLFQNQHDYELFVERKLVKKNICDVIPGSGIDTSKFAPVKVKKNKKFTFLLISRLIHDKGIIEYIEAVKKLKLKQIDADFKILGAIDEEHSRGIKPEIIQDWIDNNIVGYLGKAEDVRPFINSSDCVVLPSYREGTPRSLLEAASSEKPIVATNVPGCNNVVEDEKNGLLCELKNADDLADKMEKMYNFDNSQLLKLGKYGRQKILKEFDEGLVISKYIETINSFKRQN